MKHAANVFAVLVMALGSPCPAAWPMFRGDAARSGYTPEPLPAKLARAWVHRPSGAPQPAWPRSDRLREDRAYHVALAGGKVFYGSSANCGVHCLDAATGNVLWSFITDGPVRYAPAVWQEGKEPPRVLAVSDDGCLYCLAGADGTLLWKRRGGPAREMVLGNGRMVSRWCARGGSAIVGDVVYFGAGIWPSEGVFLYALDVRTGKTLWCNDQAGNLRMPQPHGGAVARSGVSAQGYLAVSGDVLLVPTGRAVPAGFSRKDGTLRYFHLQRYGQVGGSAVSVVGGCMLNGGMAFDPVTGNSTFRGIPASASAGAPGLIVFHAAGKLHAVDAAQPRSPGKTNAKKPGMNVKWLAALETGGSALIVADKTAVSGGAGKVATMDMKTRTLTWSAEVDGEALGLAAAEGRLVVSTDTGAIYCFAAPDKAAKRPAGEASRGVAWASRPCVARASRPCSEPAVPLARAQGGSVDTRHGQDGRGTHGQDGRGTHGQDGRGTHGQDARATGSPAPAEAVASPADAAAAEILTLSGVTEGFCVDLACGRGELAMALARRSKLAVYAVDPDPAHVAAARKRLRAAGLYGTRVTVHQADPARTPYPDYFADLAVSARSLSAAAGAGVEAEIGRLLRPGGGVALTGRPGRMKRTRRPALPGAGEWTHQYHDPGNTICGEDRLVAAPLAMLWFGSPDIRLPNRHGRGPAPLFAGGRLFVEGVDALRALDAYNGRILWEHPLPGILKPYHQEHIMGAAGTGSNFCLGGGNVFIHVGAKCLKLDQATGKQTAAFEAPPLADGKAGRWGYVAYADKTLLASLADEEHLVPYRYGRSDMGGMFTESRALLALDPDTGKARWRYDAKESIRNNTIAIAGGRVFLVDRARAQEAPGRRGLAAPQPTGVLLALDAAGGKVLWRNDKEIYGTMLAVSAEHDVLLMCYQDTRFKLASELGGRMTGLRASTGERLWEAEIKYASRPLINGRTVYAQPHAWDLLTGKQKTVRGAEGKADEPWTFARSYGCGTVSASVNLLLFRSATLGYRDLLGDRATANYGGVRPGCWINVIPAGGLVLMPDATTICRCSYLNRATVALQPRGAWPPKIQPDGGAFRGPVKVTLGADGKVEAGEIRYTLDGSTPTPRSAVYRGPVTVDRTTTLRARRFREGRPTGAVASAEFTVDPAILPTGPSAWRVWDAPGATSGPSRWTVEGDTITQHSNIFTGSAGAAAPQRVRYGTLRIYRDGGAWGDGELTLEIRSQDDDMLGVAFRFQSPEKHYLWAMDAQRSQHVLACRNGQDYKVLAANKKGFQRGRWHKVRIVLAGGKIEVFLDGRKDLQATDAAFPAGTIALHVWGNAGSSFRGLRWAPAGAGR